MHFNNKVVWITGASSGIGAEVAVQLARKKAKLILTARNQEALLQVQENCKQYTAHCQVLNADMEQAAGLEALTEKAVMLYNVIDVVIFSAGKSQRSLALDTDMQVYRRLMELNFFAPVTITQYLLPVFAKQGFGHLVPISSMAGLMGFPLRTGYAASKHALKGYFETLQTEHKIKELHITIVSPGRIKTPISLHAITGDGSPHGSMDDGQLNGISVTQCANRIITAIENKKKHLIVAKNERILWWFWWFYRPIYYIIARKTGLAV